MHVMICYVTWYCDVTDIILFMFHFVFTRYGGIYIGILPWCVCGLVGWKQGIAFFILVFKPP